jgi:hypothetical protein
MLKGTGVSNDVHRITGASRIEKQSFFDDP